MQEAFLALLERQTMVTLTLMRPVFCVLFICRPLKKVHYNGENTLGNRVLEH